MTVLSEKRAIALLSMGQALLLTNGGMLIAVNGLAGLALEPDKRLATLPVTTLVLGGALSTLPASHFMRRYGRRAGFLFGTGFGALGAAIGALGNLRQSFWLLCLGTLCSGIYNAFGQYYRLAAADVASATWKSRAISYTLAGGIVGAFLGPALGEHTRDLRTRRESQDTRLQRHARLRLDADLVARVGCRGHCSRLVCAQPARIAVAARHRDRHLDAVAQESARRPDADLILNFIRALALY